MEAREIIKAIMTRKGVTNAELARQLNVTQATIWDRLNNKKGRRDIPTNLLRSMVAPLGYKIVIISEDTQIPEDGYEVTE